MHGNTSAWLYVGDHGVPIDLRCGIDLTVATQLSIDVRKPDGTAVVWAAAVHELTSLRYTLQPGDLDASGTWRLQAHVVAPGSDRRGATAILTVRPRYG
ncbi:MAG: hypothetical protein IAE86_06935 [Burkholderiaceae bacterium]|nr:hypothetical protein [Burkholderiaceae bacterium]